MTWYTLVMTPITFLFKDIKYATIRYEWFVDSVWCFEIILSFLKGHVVHSRTVNQAAKRYMFNGPFNIGAFWFDAASTIPPMIYKEKNLKINVLKFLRLYHFKEMFYPIEIFCRYVFSKQAAYFREALISLIKFFMTVLLLAHLTACLWITVGFWDKIF